MEKVNKILLLGSSGQIGSNLKKKLKLITKKVKILSKRELNLENLNSIKYYDLIDDVMIEINQILSK